MSARRARRWLAILDFAFAMVPAFLFFALVWP
jgi:hypothetical protein